jgi:hypothetical membrane protein
VTLQRDPAVPGALSPDRAARALAIAGAAGAVSSVLLVGGLHLVAPAVDPIRRTISEYALGQYKLVFDAGVLALAFGSFAVLLGAVRSGLVAARSTATALLALWPVGLCLVVAFEKINWSLGPTPSGYVHRYASIVAFLALPLGLIALSRRWLRTPDGRRFAAWSTGLGALAIVWFSPFVLGLLARPLTGVPWYRVVPIGFVERGLALTEVLAVVVLAAWVYARAARPRTEIR